MNPTDFDRWKADLVQRFPSVTAWIEKCFADHSRQVAFLKTWRAVMSDVAIDDALEVNRLMQSGDLEGVGDYDHNKEKLPQHVRRLARAVSADRQPKADEPEYTRPAKDTDFPAGKILKRMLALQKLGTSPEEARRIALEEFPIGRPKWEPRYRCPICLDVGFVTVASNTAIEAALLGHFDKCHHREGAMRCKCKGDVPASPKHPICVYDQEQDYIATDPLWRAEETQRFIEWAHAKREAFWSSKRHHEFDQFNQREFAK